MSDELAPWIRRPEDEWLQLGNNDARMDVLRDFPQHPSIWSDTAQPFFKLKDDYMPYAAKEDEEGYVSARDVYIESTPVVYCSCEPGPDEWWQEIVHVKGCEKGLDKDGW
jgi:hypothetical protein